MASHQDSDDEAPTVVFDQKYESPWDVDRRCTDVPCLLLFLAAVVPWGYLYTYGAAHGDLALYRGLPNAEGAVCGVTPGMEAYRYLYFCKDSMGQVAFENSICVDECRNTSAGFYLCPESTNSAIYPTREMGGLLCVPMGDDAEMGAKVGQFTGPAGLLEHIKVRKWASELGMVVRAWPPIAAGVLASICFSFAFAFLLARCAGIAVWLSGGLSSLMAFGVSFQIIWDTLGGEGHDQIAESGDTKWTNFVAIVAGLFGLFNVIVLCIAADQLKKSRPNMQATGAFLREAPVMSLDPIVSLCLRLALTVVFAAGFLQLFSVYLLKEEDTQEVRTSLPLLLAYYCFVYAWMLSVLTALGEFSAAFVAQEWFPGKTQDGEDKSVSSCAPCTAMRVGLCYHLGTMAFGGFLSTTLGWLKDLTENIAHQGSQSNTCSKCVMVCCFCAIKLFDWGLKYSTRLAYCYVAINSDGFVQAARQSVQAVERSTSELVSLQGALHAFSLCGHLSAATAGAFACHLVAWFHPMFGDPTSFTYVQDPFILDVVAGLVSFAVVRPFFCVFDATSDAFVFCHALREERKQGSHDDPHFQLAPSGPGERKAEANEDACVRRSCMVWPSIFTAAKVEEAKEEVRTRLVAPKEEPIHDALTSMVDPRSVQARMGKRMSSAASQKEQAMSSARTEPGGSSQMRDLTLATPEGLGH